MKRVEYLRRKIVMGARVALSITLTAATVISCTTPKSSDVVKEEEKCEDVLKYVDPFIGTGGHVHTFPGATYPFGMIQLSPDGDTSGWDWCSGYHISDTSLKGFSHTHLSGTGWADLGDILMMPGTGEIKMVPGTKDKPEEGWRSSFSHDRERATAGYYQVMLDDYGVNVELTTDKYVGVHKYTFPADREGWVIFDPTSKIFGKVQDTKVTFVSDTKVTGYSKSTGWGGDRYVWFVAEFSKPFVTTGVSLDGKVEAGKSEITGADARGYVTFAKGVGAVEMRVAISAVDLAGAEKNLATSTGNFDAVLAKTEGVWREKISKFKVKGGTDADKRIFYTGLYHNYIAPNLNMDADGRYVAVGQTLKAEGFINYSTFSIWDTFRATHPLLSILEPATTKDFANSLISRYRDAGEHMPLWELCGFDNTCMIGVPSTIVIYDALQQGVKGIDKEEALAAMIDASYHDKTSSSDGAGGLNEYVKYGYTPASVVKSVSKTLEYAYSDWCVAELAKELGKDDVAAKYYKRALSFEALFNKDKNYFWPKTKEGEWFPDFTLDEWDNLQPHWISGNLWAYEYFTPHAMNMLIDMKGGTEGFRKSLDGLFANDLNMKGDQHVDISGFIGGYAHGDEPGHSNTYLYNYVGQPYKTQALVRRLMDEMYSDKTDGMINNEDCGQMSAWYLFSSMGIYPVCPGSNTYVIGSPLFDQVEMAVGNGKVFTVIADNQSKENVYVESVTLNGKVLDNSFITTEDILSGGTLKFKMSATPNIDWASKAENSPVSPMK